MRIPSWAVPLVLRLLSLTSLTSAGGGNAAGGDLRVAFGLGFALSQAVGAESPASTTAAESLSQPSINLSDGLSLSLDLDLFVKVGDIELKTAIMPLHLLGKKSWNVYNTTNIEKVRRDEALAAAAEAAEEERMQELDAERRMQILRGEEPTPLPIAATPFSSSTSSHNEHGGGRERKRRKKSGENDTDFEMRVAREEADRSEQLSKSSQLVLRKDDNAPLTDHKGHISLFPESQSQPKRKEKNAEAEAELAKKKKEYEDQYTMKFSNAAGFKQDIGSAPWYSKAEVIALADKDEVDGKEIVGKDVWGNEDPRRKEREKSRLVSSDPLAMMKAGAAQVRQVEKERKKWREEKEREMAILEKEEKGKRRKRRRENDEVELEDFRLDGSQRGELRGDGDGRREKAREHKRRESERSSRREHGRDRHRSSGGHSHRHRRHD